MPKNQTCSFRPLRPLHLMLIGVFIVCANGCVTPMTTRLPTFLAESPHVEKRLYERFDPFVSDDMGPDTMSRPRDYSHPRTITRQGHEDRIHNSIPAMQDPWSSPIYSF